MVVPLAVAVPCDAAVDTATLVGVLAVLNVMLFADELYATVCETSAAVGATAALVTVIVYVFVVVPFWAVTNNVIVLLPTFKLIAALAVPDATVVPFTFTVALACATVGVSVMDEIEFATDAL